VCGDDTCQDEYHSSSTTPFSNPLPSPISSPPTSTHTPTPAPSPTSTLLINDTGVITDEVHLLGTHCCANSSTLHFCGLKESALQSEGLSPSWTSSILMQLPPSRPPKELSLLLSVYLIFLSRIFHTLKVSERSHSNVVSSYAILISFSLPPLHQPSQGQYQGWG
jgi:hypothetical protein